MRVHETALSLAGELVLLVSTTSRTARTLFAGVLLLMPQVAPGLAQAMKARNLDASRERATALPRTEDDQALVDGWPLYRTERGQTSFNDTMATLKATEDPAPQPGAFKGCQRLECPLALPAATADGWLPAGRYWVSPSEYVLVVHSPRNRDGRYGRRSIMNMQYFVFHEFHNSSRNTDLHDTISSHSRAVFVPLYMSKQGADVRGRSYVVVVQVAPLDVVSIHATNYGSAGPGIEVAKNASEPMQPLQGLAGILVATIAKTAVPRLKVVNHHGSEGRPMLDGYERRLALLRGRTDAPVTLPFVAAQPQQVAAATGRLEELIVRRGLSPRIPVAERALTPPRTATLAPTPAAATMREPMLIEAPRIVPRPIPASQPALVGPVRPALRPAHRS
jgi:hypothetical protein